MVMKRSQQGMTIIEVMGALAIAATLLLSLTTMIGFSLDDAKGQQTALYQEQVVNAASQYISDSNNYGALVSSTADGTVATLTIAQLKTAKLLSNSFSSTNPFNQAPCVLIQQPAAGKLDVLVVTYGGMAIPERDLPMVAMEAGQGGGYISTSAPGTARGASWQMDTTSYRGPKCGDTQVLDGANDGGHLASALFYNGPGQLPTDFLYRNPVPGKPELNQMNTPIHMMLAADAQQNAQATEGDTGDPRCTNNDTGKIAVDVSGRVLSCQSGEWKRQGSGFWKDPVNTYDLLPAAGNDIGDVRMVIYQDSSFTSNLNRAFTWDGSSWVALAVDQNGNLVVPNTLSANLVQLNQTAVQNDPCPVNGMIARDATGMSLSCQNGSWRSPLGVRLTNLAYFNGWELTPSDGVRDLNIDLASLPGAHPLYLTGYSDCHATGTARAYASVDMLDAAGNAIAYGGGCLSQLDSPGIGLQNLGDIGLQKLPENVTQLHVRVEPGSAAGDYANLLISIYSE